MITLKEHIATIIASSERSFLYARQDGVLHFKDLYLLDILYKLLKNKNLSENYEDYHKLYMFYKRMLLCSVHICPPKIMKEYVSVVKNPFYQAEVEDCNTYTDDERIYYFQLPAGLPTDYLHTPLINVYVTLIFNRETTPYFTRQQFMEGVDVPFTSRGRYVFLAVNINNLQPVICDVTSDILNESEVYDVYTHRPLNATVIVSTNEYINDIINFKIEI